MKEEKERKESPKVPPLPLCVNDIFDERVFRLSLWSFGDREEGYLPIGNALNLDMLLPHAPQKKQFTDKNDSKNNFHLTRGTKSL